MFDLTFLQIVIRTLAGVIVLSVLGGLVAAAAVALGDKGPRYDGRLTLNPVRHVDIFGIVGAIIAQAGWIRPIRIDPGAGRLGRITPILAALLAMAGTLLFAWLVGFLQPWVASSWPTSSAAFVAALLRAVGDVAAWTAALNLLPIPPLLGGYLLQAVAPAVHERVVKYAFWISLGLAAILVLTYRNAMPALFGDLARALGAR